MVLKEHSVAGRETVEAVKVVEETAVVETAEVEMATGVAGRETVAAVKVVEETVTEVAATVAKVVC